MSEEPQEESVFDDFEGEPPAEGAQTFGPASAPETQTTGDGHLRVSTPVGDIDPFDHSAEVAAEAQAEAGHGVAPPPLPQDEPELPRNPGMMVDATASIEEEMERRFSDELGEIKVEVTPEERAAFVRAALHDQDLLFKVDLEGLGIEVEVVIPPESYTAVVTAACRFWGEQEWIDKDSDLQWVLLFQQLHALYQIRSIDGRPTEWAALWKNGMPTDSMLKEILCDREVVDSITRMSSIRWKMLVTAIRVAEAKCKICLTNWKNRSFFTGADTA